MLRNLLGYPALMAPLMFLPGPWICGAKVHPPLIVISQTWCMMTTLTAKMVHRRQRTQTQINWTSSWFEPTLVGLFLTFLPGCALWNGRMRVMGTRLAASPPLWTRLSVVVSP